MMRNRHPAGQRMDPYVARTGGARGHSPAARLAPTRAPAPRRRRHGASEARRPRPLVRLVNGLLTFAVALMILAGAAGYVFDGQLDAAGPLQQPKSIAIPKNEGTLE